MALVLGGVSQAVDVMRRRSPDGEITAEVGRLIDSTIDGNWPVFARADGRLRSPPLNEWQWTVVALGGLLCAMVIALGIVVAFS